jgi:hypothetical protein
MKRIVLVLSLALAAAGLSGFATSAQAGDPGTAHLPDLVTRTPSDIRIQRDKATGTKVLRFSNTVANLGRGRLELRPVHDSVTDTTLAYQRVYTHDAAGNWSLQSQFPVGTFQFHETHNHWHYDDFALYELRNVAPDGSVGATVLRSSGKVTFCIIDTVSVDLTLEHASPTRGFTTCNQSDIQGLSVGWADTYGWSLPGQSIDISGLPSGEYWLVSTADPDGLISETNDANNAGAVKIKIRGNRLK